MYLLNSLRPEFSEDGITPNNRFQAQYLALVQPSSQRPSLPLISVTE